MALHLGLKVHTHTICLDSLLEILEVVLCKAQTAVSLAVSSIECNSTVAVLHSILIALQVAVSSSTIREIDVARLAVGHQVDGVRVVSHGGVEVLLLDGGVAQVLLLFRLSHELLTDLLDLLGGRGTFLLQIFRHDLRIDGHVFDGVG